MLPRTHTLGIMQPYFFPYLGHFSLISAVDQWIVFDITQYTPRTWMNRNRILHPEFGWQYVTVPLSNSSPSIKTYQATIKSVSNTRKEILGKISHYRNKCPNFRSVWALIEELFDSQESNSLTELNVLALKLVCGYLNIPFNYQIASELSLVFPEAMNPGDWALEICRQCQANRYINPISGATLFDRDVYKRNDIELRFLKFNDFTYETGKYFFQPHLSILDILMWNDTDTIRAAVANYSLE